jgi:V8-like Glu-specific endopeptidase
MPSRPVLRVATVALALGLAAAARGQAGAGDSAVKTVQAGSPSSSPADSPDVRIDPNVFNSPFAGIGSLRIVSGTRTFNGTAVAVSPWYVLTAGHNVDDDDNGVVDSNLQITFNLNAGGDLSASITGQSFVLNPSFTGFNHPTLAADLALVRLSSPLPASTPIYPILGSAVTVGQPITFAGYGGSGTGDLGYTISASLTRKRVGSNVIDNVTSVGGVPAIFDYDFDGPATTGLLGGSLGNGIESIIGPGDSGSPAFVSLAGTYFLAGINTFTMGENPGRFGSQGGGVLLQPYLRWIAEIAATAPIITTQPASAVVAAGAAASFTVTAESGSAVSYQWRKDNLALSGATRQTLSFTAVQRSDAGVYTVVVSNDGGATTSQAAELAVNSAAPPQVLSQPAAVSVTYGEKARFSVNASGTVPLSYQWYEGQPGDATRPVAGATGTSVTVPAVVRSTPYWVRIADGGGNVTYSQAAVASAVAAASVSASQAVLGAGFTPGGAITVQVQISHSASVAARLECSVLLPLGWRVLSASGPAGATSPQAGNENLAEWTWLSAPTSPVVVTCTLLVPTSAASDQPLATLVTLRQDGIAQQALAKPDPLVARTLTFHSADTDRDSRLSLLELTRVIELYNTRTGTVRTGKYKVKAGTEDGFVNDP